MCNLPYFVVILSMIKSGSLYFRFCVFVFVPHVREKANEGKTREMEEGVNGDEYFAPSHGYAWQKLPLQICMHMHMQAYELVCVGWP